MSPFFVLLTVAIGVVVLLVVLQRKAEKQRLARFEKRGTRSFDQWYEQYYESESDPIDKLTVRLVLEAFGEAFDVEPTRLRPSDRLVEELSLDIPGALDDAWDVVDAILAHKLNMSVKWDARWQKLDDVIHGIIEQQIVAHKSRTFENRSR